ncbi:MAG: hypothetical protein ACLFV7_14155 [Phycisphaerae bacterium]
MKWNLCALVLAAIAFGLWTVPATTAPKPAEAPTSWELDFTYQKPTPIMVRVPGEDTTRRFWFLRYKVVNRTGEDVGFTPEFVLYTDTGELLKAGRNVPSVVFDKIKKVYNDPLLRTQTGMIGKLLQGADNAKRGVAIFPDFDPNAGYFDLMISGLSGESTIVDLPVPIKATIGGQEVMKKQILLSKTLRLRYDVSGSAGNRTADSIKLDSKKWVMR